jgi:hypothetical protein
MQTSMYRNMSESAEKHNQDTISHKQKVDDQIDTLQKLRAHVDSELSRLKTLSWALGVVADSHSTRQLTFVAAVKQGDKPDKGDALITDSSVQKATTPKAANG